MATSNTQKKIVQSTEPAAPEPAWQPKPEDRAKANRLRLFAIIAWVIAIAVECVAIFGLILAKPVQVDVGDGNGPVNQYSFLGMTLSQNGYFAWLIILIVLCGIIAIVGSLLWKQANRLDPASEKDTVRFFIQNQLGAIITLIAFIPLVILVAMDKNLKGAQKGIATGVAVVVLVIATLFGVETKPASQEQYATDSAITVAVNGTDTVYWVKGSDVYHLCSTSSYLNQPSKDNQIYSGTTAQGAAAVKNHSLTVVTECNYNPTTGTIVSTGQKIYDPTTNTMLTGNSTTAPQPTDTPTG